MLLFSHAAQWCSVPSLLEIVQSKPIRYELRLPPALAIFVVQYASDCLACCQRPKTTIIHHRVYLPLDPFFPLYLEVTVKQVRLTDNISVNIPLNLLLFIFIFQSCFSTFNALLWIYINRNLIYMTHLMCLSLFLQACYHCMKCFVKEALLQNMNYETL